MQKQPIGLANVSGKPALLTLKKAREQDLWFISKRYGWGWTPITWQGWLSLLVYVALMLREAERVIDYSMSHSDADSFIEFAPGFVLITMFLILICYAKGERPRWRWGK